MKSFAKYWLPVIIYASIIFYYSSLSYPLGDIPLSPHADKFIHFFEFAFLGLLLRRALLNTRAGHLQRQAILWTIILGIAYGASDEIHQYFIPCRTATFWDLWFDTFGILGSLWLKIK